MSILSVEDHDNLKAAALDRIAELIEENLDDNDLLFDVSDIAGVVWGTNVRKEIQVILREISDEIQGLNF